MRLPFSKTRLITYLCGAALVAFGFVFLSQKTQNTFAERVNADGSSEESKDHDSQPDHFVIIHDQGTNLQIKTNAITVREALERANYELAETDKVEPGLTSQIDSDNYHINIYRSRPVLVDDGIVKTRLMTASYDARTIAEEAGLTVYDGDSIALVRSTNFLEVGDLSTYKITRNGGRTITVEQSIPYSEETVRDMTIESGKKEVRQQGEDGRKVIKFKVNFVNGVEASRELISETVEKEPVNKIVAVGSKKSVPPEWSTCEKWAREAGVSEKDMYAALTLIYHESGCRVDSENAYSGAYGIPQSLPGNKMASEGSDWKTNPVTQIRWMIKYVNGRYGGWQQALDFWYCTGTCKGVTKNGYWY